MSPINSPLVPWMRVPRWQTDSVTVVVRRVYAFRVWPLTGRHGDAGRDTAFVLDVYNLVVHDVILALVHAGAVVGSVECLGHVFNVENLGIYEMPGPLLQNISHGMRE